MGLHDVGDEVPLRQDEAHTFVPLGHAVAGCGDAELEGHAACRVHTLLQPLRDGVEVDVPGVDVGLRVDDADEWLVHKLIDVVAGSVKEVLPYQADGEIAVIEYGPAPGLLHGYLLVFNRTRGVRAPTHDYSTTMPRK
jgi:hypothetical protein